MKFIKYSLILVVLTLSTACSTQKETELKIIANSWVGYSPLFYAKESGWLAPLNIQLYTVISLGESLNIYETAELDAFTGTQYEFTHVQQKDSTLLPILLFDRSNGGDVIMANRTLNQLKNSTQPIEVYLEMHSVNQLVFKDFIQLNGLNDKTFNYINKDQLKIYTLLKENKPEYPVIIASYSPYQQKLASLGLQKLASTQDGDGLSLLIIDALFTSKEKLLKHQAQFTQLKTLINNALIALKKDPFEYYQKVKPYLENTSYPDFLSSLEGIKWLNQPLTKEQERRLNNIQFPTKDLL